eukprot:5503738-Prymnesium_polylepis.1
MQRLAKALLLLGRPAGFVCLRRLLLGRAPRLGLHKGWPAAARVPKCGILLTEAAPLWGRRSAL